LDVKRPQTPPIDETASFPKLNKGRAGPDIRIILSPTPRPLSCGPRRRWREKMPIEDTTFGSITIDGKTYEHDVIIRLSGQVEKRRKKLSKEKYGTSHIVSKEEAKFIYEDGSDLLIIGAGQEGNVRLSPEASDYLEKKGCAVTMQPTPEAIQSFNESRRKKIGLMHVTC
jgi:hypothetical protein